MALKTLADHATEQAAAYAAARIRAADALAALAPRRAPALAALDQRTADVVVLRADADALRARLAAGPPAAVAEQLGLELEGKLQAAHEKQLAIVDAQDGLAELDAQASALGRHAERAGAAEREALGRLEAATGRVAEQAAWEATVGRAPVRDIPANAGVAAGAQGAAAKARLRGGDLPVALFDRAEARWTLARNRIAAVVETADDAETEVARQTGAAEQKRLVYERARAVLGDFAMTAEQELEAALALLGAVTGAPALPEDAKERLAGTRRLSSGAVDPEARDLFDNGTMAAIAEQARDVRLADVDTAQAAVDPARIAAIIANPDREIENVTAVRNARRAVSDARAAAPQAAYVAVVDGIDAWEAAVPEATWTLFEAYESAAATLARLAGVTPGDLVSELKTAEDAYIVELGGVSKAARVRWALDELADIRLARAAAARRNRDGRLLAALRGDSWEDA